MSNHNKGKHWTCLCYNFSKIKIWLSIKWHIICISGTGLFMKTSMINLGFIRFGQRNDKSSTCVPYHLTNTFFPESMSKVLNWWAKYAEKECFIEKLYCCTLLTVMYYLIKCYVYSQTQMETLLLQRFIYLFIKKFSLLFLQLLKLISMEYSPQYKLTRSRTVQPNGNELSILN